MTKRPYDAIDREPSSSDMERLTLRDQNADYDVNMDDSDHKSSAAVKASLGPRGATPNVAFNRELIELRPEKEDGRNVSDLRSQQNHFLSHISNTTDVSSLEPDHTSRPLWISADDGNIILETFSPNAEKAKDFLIAIAEPVSRPEIIHEYKITAYSLYAAASVGLETSDIIKELNRFSKVPVPETIVNFIKKHTMSYGKVKLVLKHNKYYVESNDPDILQMLSNDPAISASMKKPSYVNGVGVPITVSKAQQWGNPGTPEVDKTKDTDSASKATGAELFTAVIGVENDDSDIDQEDENVHAFEIDDLKIDAVKKRCNDLDYPMLEEYDFQNDTKNANLNVDLKPATVIRPYQEKCLSRVFAKGRVRSGIIILPCGVGKTLVGIAAACRVKKSCLVLCISSDSVMQWKSQFMKWSNVTNKQIAIFTANHKETLPEKSGIVVATYSMVANSNRSHESTKMMEYIKSRTWFIILDEVQAAPDAMFRKALTVIKAYSKLGLTATLDRDGDKIMDLNYMVGPKLYEANFQDLPAKGHTANVQCAEVWCPMTPEFYREYLQLGEQSRERRLLYCMNPSKFQACQFLIQYHEKRGDKIIVFSDNVYALEAYAKKLGKLFIHGKTPQVKKTRIRQRFQHDQVNTIFLSIVEDTSIMLEATCLIQISSHFGSRSQEAQRLGRLLHAKRKDDAGFNGFFYSLVSKDTEEMSYSTNRQQIFIDHGYPFKVITHLDGMDSLPDLVYKTRDQQIELLSSVLLANESGVEPGPVREAPANKKARKQRIIDTNLRYLTTRFEK